MATVTLDRLSKRYPGTPERGSVIRGLDAAAAGGARIFHAGTALKDGGLVASGGRVLNVTATGRTVFGR